MLINSADVAMAAVIFGSIGGTIVTVTRLFVRRSELREQLRSSGGSETELRLQRMEQAIDAIAVEVERMSEAQRFTTRLLAERLPSAQQALPAHHPSS